MSEYDRHIFNQQLALRESGAVHSVQNALGSSGRYQLGEKRLDDFNRAMRTQHTISEFLHSPALQEQVQDWHIADIDRYIDRTGLRDCIGQKVSGVKLSRNSLRAVAHLGGKSALRKFLLSDGNHNPADANGTRLSDYAMAFANVSDRPVRPGQAADLAASSVVFPKEAVAWARRDNTLGRNLPIGEPEGLKFRVDPHRSASTVSSIVDWLNVDTSERYKAKDGDTFCNVYASDFCYLAGAYLPRVWGLYGAEVNWNAPSAFRLKPSEMTANALFDWLKIYGGHFGWRQVGTLDTLQANANDGCCCLIIAKSTPNRHGHISIVCPERPNRRAVREADQVLIPVQSQTRLEDGRSSERAQWWDQDAFVDFGFWINDCTSWQPERLKPNRVLETLTKLICPDICAHLDATLAIYRDEVERLNGMPDAFVQALVAGEDKRFFQHPGFDSVAIFRAMYRFCTKRKVEGASTIEQQLVRTITGRKDRTIRRKLTEILLALRISSALDKRTIALIYLHNAYFGWRALGFQNALKRPEFLRPTEAQTAAHLTASLRYPVAKTESDQRQLARARRVDFILNRMSNQNQISAHSHPQALSDSGAKERTEATFSP